MTVFYHIFSKICLRFISRLRFLPRAGLELNAARGAAAVKVLISTFDAMKILRIKSVFVALMLIAISGLTQKITVATYNLRFDNPRDSGNLWKDRAQPSVDLIRFHQIDVFGIQEGLINQLEDLSKGLPEFERYGKGRDDGGTKGEHAAVFYNKKKFERLRAGDFWFSETPNIPGKGWDATCCNRIASWVQLREKKSGKTFYFFSAHFDHQGKTAQLESARLLLQKIKEIAGDQPVIAVGDFNVGRDSEPYKVLAASTLLRDAYHDVQYPYQLNGSFNDFGRDFATSMVIDHIFLSAALKATRWGLLTDTYRGKYPSDHFPVLADVHFKGRGKK